MSGYGYHPAPFGNPFQFSGPPSPHQMQLIANELIRIYGMPAMENGSAQRTMATYLQNLTGRRGYHELTTSEANLLLEILRGRPDLTPSQPE